MPRFSPLAVLPLGLVGAALLVTPAPARAEDPPPPAKETQFFEKFDTNLDGKVTKEEFAAGQGDAAAFALLDKNKDDAISPDELGLPADYKPKPRREGSGGAGAGTGPGGQGMPGGPGGGRPGDEMRRRLKEMDADGDGRVSRAEWKGEPEGFDRMDRNKDGFLDKEDQPRGMGLGGPRLDPEAVKARWKKMDRDGDGKVSKDEYTGDFDFDRLDSDKDGFLTDADAKALPGLMGGGGPGGNGPGGPGGKGPAPIPTPEEIAKRFGELDKDQSGKVEAAEMPEGLRERMLKADADGDGALTKDEFGEGMKKNARREGQQGQPGGAGKPPPEGGPGIDLLKRFDHDHDGRVERDQFPGSDEKFAELDKDGDGVLTEKDFAPAKPKEPSGKDPSGKEPGAKEGGKAPPPAEGLIAKCDADGDGKLSRAEFHGTDDEWRRLDKNQDGWVTADEAPPPPAR